LRPSLDCVLSAQRVTSDTAIVDSGRALMRRHRLARRASDYVG
jgi:hypothetical protein